MLITLGGNMHYINTEIVFNVHISPILYKQFYQV